MTVPTGAIPEAAARAARRYLDELVEIFGDDVAGAWIHGGTTFPDRPLTPGDVDICVVLHGVAPDERDPRGWLADPSSRPHRADAARRSVSDACGLAFDPTFLLRGGMSGGTPPRDAFNRDHPVLSWPIFRAHWLAGRYVHLAGARPEGIVTAPTDAEIRSALDRELEHLERHVHEGDAEDPYEATYAVWTGCRIVFTLTTGSPVISKRSAGRWGLEHLPPVWHPAISAAGRAYDGRATGADKALLSRAMAPFVEMVRARLPPTGPRPAGPPRSS